MLLSVCPFAVNVCFDVEQKTLIIDEVYYVLIYVEPG